MIKQITINDLNFFNELGLLVNKNFTKLFNLNNIISTSYEYIYGYYENNSLIGFIHISKMYEVLDIINIVVNPQYRKLGIATKLINYIIDNFKDVKSIMLEVSENNKSAINLYNKLNFKQISERKNYYGESNALIMKRDVNI